MTAVSGRAALVIGLAVAALAIVGFALAEAFHVTLLVDPGTEMTGRGLSAGIGAALLVADIVLPVPSSIVMVAHGALFGVVPGAALSLLGRTGNAVAGVAIGRGAGRLVAQRPTGATRGAALVERWGLAAVVLTRPVPVLAESTVIAAGAMGLSVPAVVAAALVGAVPEAVIYAVAGSRAASSSGAAAVFVAVVVLAAGMAAAGARLDIRRHQAAG